MNSKPSWDDAPAWAQYLAMDSDLNWFWHEDFPVFQFGAWQNEGQMTKASSPVGKDTLEGRPPIFSGSFYGGKKQ